ncbi:MAG TPA: HPr-rel-A system PqqD family peptide chaperone [Stellaceae bacterium]|nr:HPr-rel-A system PqqD family peptide chaperone [Stellaceae bacterium]
MTRQGARRIGAFVQWREWNGEIVAYNDRTGDTHHFADLAAWMFRLLATRAASEDAIAAAAASEIELPAAIDRAAAIARTLDLFARLDLIEAA